ncbi:O-methyltransferase-domain-containing protein [Flagelloscypha sp. PMI_526]|nr:O-methyltransferase-domain-containing protein [Flagelloscypha sp. PMI_526]
MQTTMPPMVDPRQQIQQLLDLVNESVQAALVEYEKTSQGIPSPNLVKPHELDGAADAVALKRSLRVLEGACEALCSTLAQPMHTLVNRAMAPYESQCQKIAITYRFADALLPHPEGLHIDDLAKTTGLPRSKLSHIIRLLATRNCFREVSRDVFANNRLSLTLLSTNPVSDLIGTFSDECFQGVWALHDVLSDSEYGPAVSEEKAAFAYALRSEMPGATLFDYLKKNPAKMKRFGRGMIGWSKLTASVACVDDYPWSKYKSFCDLGSGLGHQALALIRKHPHMKIVLQELPGPTKAAREFWTQEHPDGVANGSVRFVEVDFFREDPVPDMDLYYLKHIIHNWPDATAQNILKRIRSVMPAHGRVLIHEFVTQSTCPGAFDNSMGLQKAPEPLLPNYGSGQYRTFAQDISMMSMFNACQRNVGEFARLGERCGLTLLKAWDYGEAVLLEFAKAV